MQTMFIVAGADVCFVFYMSINRTFSFLFSAIVLLLPSLLFADVGAASTLVGDTGGLVPCRGGDCGTCEIVVLTNRLIQFVIILLLALVALLFGWAGFLMVTSGGDQSAYTRAKGMFANVFVGLLIVLSGWLVVDTVLKVLLTNGGQVTFGPSLVGPWNQIPAGACSSQKAFTDSAEITQFANGWEGLNIIYTEDEASDAPAWYLVFLKDEANNCKRQVSLGFSGIEACNESYNSTIAGYEYYTANYCSGTTGTEPPNFNSLTNCTSVPDGGGGGACTVYNSGPCAVGNLSCFGDQAANASRVCSQESGNNPRSVSKTDLCKDGNSFSHGLFQINILVHYNKINSCNNSFFTLHGSGAQGGCAVPKKTNSKGLTYCPKWNCTINKASPVYNSCIKNIHNPAVNINLACQLFNNSGNDFGPWAYSAGICGAPH